ncbi:MAG: hypothetical protein JW943_15085 [Deltaproteobacteria bacterium]|nr:hypothetical protein [Deltaproteobacteria bacterium]
MKNVKWIIIPCFLIFLSSCTAPIVKYQTANPAYTWMQEPPAGSPAKAEVGQAVTIEALAAVFDGFVSRGRYEIHIHDDVALFPKTISPEDEYIIWGSLPNGDVVVRNMAFARVVRSDRESGKLELALIARKNGEVYGYAPFTPDAIKVEKFDRTIKLEPQKISVPVDYRQETVYQGKKKGKDVIKLSSLDYIDDMAAPVSEQEMIYDLAVSRTISCKGAVLEIIEAADNALTFVVKRYLIMP